MPPSAVWVLGQVQYGLPGRIVQITAPDFILKFLREFRAGEHPEYE